MTVPLARPTPRFRILVPPKFEHHLLGRFVLNGGQLLKNDRAGCRELIARKMRAAEQIGKNVESRQQIFRKRGAAKAGVAVGNRFAALDAQAFEIFDKGPAIAWSRTAQRQLTYERAQAQPVSRIERAAGRNQEGEGGRLERQDGL